MLASIGNSFHGYQGLRTYGPRIPRSDCILCPLTVGSLNLSLKTFSVQLLPVRACVVPWGLVCPYIFTLQSNDIIRKRESRELRCVSEVQYFVQRCKVLVCSPRTMEGGRSVLESWNEARNGGREREDIQNLFHFVLNDGYVCMCLHGLVCTACIWLHKEARGILELK